MARRAATPALTRKLMTPEGVPLTLSLASAGARASAFAIDMVVIVLALIVMTLLAAAGFWIVDKSYPGVILVIWLIGFFLLRNFYFIWFESGRRSATWGKRRLGLRVVARDGGRLSGSAIIARNMMREVEIFLPLMFLAVGAAEGFVSRWTTIAGLGWALIFLLMPLFNRERLRAGDLIGGTWVVETARRDLGSDLVAQTSQSTQSLAFSQAELETYGQYELQRLEAVLRHGDPTAITTVADAIRGKLNRWDNVGDRAFLDAYYAQTRAHFERALLMGRRKRDKFDTEA